MKRLLFILAFVCASFVGAQAQTKEQTKFEVCDSSNIYRVEDTLLADKGFGSAPLVETNPQFTGGVEALQKFFDDNLKLGDEAKSVFGRIPIALTVNCKGKVGDFKFLGKVFPEMAQEIIKVAEKMPDWKAGEAKGKAVDTVVRLSFTISQGKAKVSFK